MATAYAMKYDVDLTHMPLCSEGSISGELLIVQWHLQKLAQYADRKKMMLHFQKPA